MRIRLFSACFVSAALAALASAQTPPSAQSPYVAVAPIPIADAPPRVDNGVPVFLPVSAEPPPRSLRPAVVIEAQEGPPSASPVPPPTTPAPTTAVPATAVPATAVPATAVPATPGSATPESATPESATRELPAPTTTATPTAGPLVKTGLLAPWSDAPRLKFNPNAPAASPTRFWVDNEVLLWWIQGNRLPPLVTTSPPGAAPAVAGNLGFFGTSIYGPGSQDNNMRLGYRLTVGGYLDDERHFALEANFMMTANGGNQFNASSPGTPILARPVIDGAGGTLLAEPIAIPGIANGSIHISTTTTGILGTGIWLRECFTRSDDPCDTCHPCAGGSCAGGNCNGGDPGRWYCRFDSLFGYRYLRLSDNLEIDDTINAVAPLNNVPAGSSLMQTDQFHASNTFHGIDLGMTGEMSRGGWTIAATAKVAVGFNDSSIDIFGEHNLNGVLLPGGVLAQPTNMGHFSHTLTSAVPELDLKLGYSFSPTVKVFVGYSFLYWYHVLRAADQINPYVDSAFLTSGVPTATAPTQPVPIMQDRSIWMQGVTVGFEWRY